MITIVKLNTWWHALNFFITSKTPEFVVIKFENKYIWYIKDSIFLNVGITVLHICSLVYVLLFIASTYIIHLFCKIKTFLSQAIGGYTKNMEWSPADVSMVINDDHLPCGSGKEHLQQCTVYINFNSINTVNICIFFYYLISEVFIDVEGFDTF